MTIIGSGWTKKNDEGKLKSISIALNEDIQELCPNLKGVKFSISPIPKEQRSDKENAPTWRVSMFKPQKQTETTQKEQTTTDEVDLSDEEIPY